jgi:uncharacterized protein (DUF2252 family)
LNSAPLTWICGDLHLENFGTYQGQDRQIYFEINDFDEGALAPCTWDLARCLTSLYLAAPILVISETDSQLLSEHFLETYFQTLSRGKIDSLNETNAEGPVQKLIEKLKNRSRQEFLEKRTRQGKNGRKFELDPDRFRAVTETEADEVKEMVRQLARGEKERGFFKIQDIAFRVAGTGSLGLRRYAALVEGPGSPDENLILDLKEQRAPALEPYLRTPQPGWNNSAARTAAIQAYCQAQPPALLAALRSGPSAYLIRELQPVQDKIDLADLAGKPRAAWALVENMARVVAWGQLRSAGKNGAASLEALIAFGEKRMLKAELLAYAQTYARQVDQDFKQFARIYTGENPGRL